MGEEQTANTGPSKSYKDFQTGGDRKGLGRKGEEGFLVINHYPYCVQYYCSRPWEMTCYFLLNVTKAKPRTKWWILNLEYAKRICHLLSIKRLHFKKKQGG